MWAVTAVAALFLSSCAHDARLDADGYLDWMYKYMPLPDSLTYDANYWKANVEKTLEVRDRMNWGIPEREFRHFVLPLRANNETLDDFRTEYADTLCRRIEGMSLAEAALEVNHWCHEQATYQPSDARTSSPTATMRNGLGRCGEESVLAVAALRAAGIPARQVYTPRWAHTDDNHAWVEVWVDGKWWFMGACEPAPTLNNAWFNSPVSRAMLLHTNVYGMYEGDEDVISRNSCFTEINVINGYVRARENIVTVLDEDGRPVAGARVEFKIYNYAEFYTVAKYTSDRKGRATLESGCGDLVVWAAKDDRFGFAVAKDGTATIVLDHTFGETFSADLDIVPPVEDPIPTNASEEQVALCGARLAEEDSIRDSHDHVNHDLEAFSLRKEKGVKELVSMLCVKDRKDITMAVLEDALAVNTDLDPYVLNPRVELEALLPCRAEILSSGIADRLLSVSDIAEWVRDSIAVDNVRNPRGFRIPPVSVWRGRIADTRSRNIFFVALCRTLGFPARIDDVTGKTQYRENGVWMDMDLDGSVAKEPHTGYISASYAGGNVKTPHYYSHYSITAVDRDGEYLLDYEREEPELSRIPVDAGYYLLVSGTRLSSGSVLAHLEFFNVEEGETTQTTIRLRQAEAGLSVIGSMDAEKLFLKEGECVQQSLLSATGRGYFVVAVMGEKDEPSTHARLDLEGIASELNAWPRPFVVLSESGVRISGLENAVYGRDVDGKVMKMLCDGCESSSPTLPVVAVCDSFGRIVYFSQGYNTSLASDLLMTISLL